MLERLSRLHDTSSKMLATCTALVLAAFVSAQAQRWTGPLRTLEDSGRSIAVQDALAQHAGWIVRPPRWIPHFGLSRSAFWIARTWSTTPGDTTHRTLLVRSSVIDTLDIYFVSDGLIHGPYRFGDRLPFDSRAIPCRQFALPIVPGKDGSALILMRTASHDGLHESIPFEILETRQFERACIADGFRYGLYFGSLALLALLSLLLFPALRDISQIAFAGYALSYCAWNAIFLGFADAFVWPGHPRSNAWIMLTSLAFSIFLALFTSRFLQMRKRMPRLRRVALAIVLAGTIPAIPFALLDRYRDFFIALLSMDLVLLPLLLGAGVLSAWRGSVQGRIFLVSWTPTVIAAVLLFGKILGLLPAWEVIGSAYLYGTVFHTLVLSVGAAFRIMAIQRRANQDLEAQVQARTHDLEEANHRLEELSATDFLTGLPNRRRFLERYQAVCGEFLRGQTPLTVILLDVDNFKAYNDRLGHLAGDVCLQQVAQSLQTSLRRSSDFCARYGGEEFVMCLVNTPFDEAMTVAERVREGLEGQALPHPASPTSPVVTISLGIAAGTVGSKLEELLRRADTSLYQAKHLGRNRVGPAG